jgi:hypothetical protein
MHASAASTTLLIMITVITACCYGGSDAPSLRCSPDRVAARDAGHPGDRRGRGAELKGLAADFGGYVELGDGTALSARGRGRWRWARATAIDARARSARKQPHDRVRPARR